MKKTITFKQLKKLVKESPRRARGMDPNKKKDLLRAQEAITKLDEVMDEVYSILYEWDEPDLSNQMETASQCVSHVSSGIDGLLDGSREENLEYSEYDGALADIEGQD